MWKLTLFLFLIGAFSSQCLAQSLKAHVNMEGVKAVATFTVQQDTSDLYVSMEFFKGFSLLSGQVVTLEIVPIWVYYDQENRCSNLGSPILQKIHQFPNTEQGPVAFMVGTLSQPDVSIVESFSVRLRSGQNLYCATMQRENNYNTAVAAFRGPNLFGNVYFRQSTDGSTMPTRIVSSLQTTGNVNSMGWKIVNNMAECTNTAFNSLNTFNPMNVDGNDCTQTALNNCAVGALSQKFNNLPVSSISSAVVQSSGYTDTNLAISGSNGVQSKVLAIDTNDGQNVCAEIKLFHQRQGQVWFSEDGVAGYMMFTQRSPFDVTETKVNLTGLQSLAGGYHVHKWPRPIQTVSSMSPCAAAYVSGHLNPSNKDVGADSYPSPTAGTDDQYEIGDLSFKYGLLNTKTDLSGTFLDWNLPLFGKNNIIGRSLVIHKNDPSASRWICSNIESTSGMVAAIAKFKHPVIGQVIFMQGVDMPDSDTTIFTQLDYLYGGTTKSHNWRINTNKISGDQLSSDVAARCQSTKPIYNPSNIWSTTNEVNYNMYCKTETPQMCKLGDLKGKHGPVSVRDVGPTENSAEGFYTDSNLPLSGAHSIVGRSVVIFDDSSLNILACADIMPLHGLRLQAKFSDGSVVNLKQNPGYGARKTTVTHNLRGITQGSLHIYEVPPDESSSNPCDSLGNVYNPLDVTAPSSTTVGTDSQYPVGNLARYGVASEFNSMNLPLSGVTSVRGRGLVLMTGSGSKMCASLLPPASVVGIPQIATVKITGDVQGTAHLSQTLYDDGSMSDTTILLHFNNAGGTVTTNHNWHVHVTPIGGDANAASGKCDSAGGHYDPYNAIADEAVYAAECKLTMPLHCEVGDQANKLGTYNIGGGKALYNDVDLPLAGDYSVLGRSLVFHVVNRGAPRLACADIIPASSTPIGVKFKTPANLDKRAGAQLYATAINAPSSAVVLEVLSQESGNTEANVHFVGLKREMYRALFVAYFSKDENRENFGDYAPIEKLNVGDGAENLVRAPVLLIVLMISVCAALL